MSKEIEKERGFRQSMSWLHTWVGLVPGWILYFMFVMGTASYFTEEITRWMEPELPYIEQKSETAAMAKYAQEYFTKNAKNSEYWRIRLPEGRKDFVYLSWQEDKILLEESPDTEKSLDTEKTTATVKPTTMAQDSIAEETKTTMDHAENASHEDSSEDAIPKEVPHEHVQKIVAMNPLTGKILANEPRETGGGDTLYRMHYALHYLNPTVARYLVIFCTFCMLAGLITGVIVHKKIFKDFFTFRPQKGQRSWLDGHNLLSVLTLPFQFMITYSGLMLLFTSIFPVLLMLPLTSLGVDMKAGLFAEKNREVMLKVAEVFPIRMPNKRQNIAADVTPLGQVVLNAEDIFGKRNIRQIYVSNPLDTSAKIFVYESGSQRITGRQMTVNGVTGEIVSSGKEASGAILIQNTVNSLHMGLFSPYSVRWLYFFSGLLGTAMVGTGLVLWTVKRRTRAQKANVPHRGLAFVERMNIGTMVGLPIGVAAYFWANRLLSLDMTARGEGEVSVMFITWGVMLLYAVIRPVKRAWMELNAFAALAFGFIPLVNFLTTDRHLGQSIAQGDWVYAGFDLTMLGFACAFGLTARYLWKSSHVTNPKKTQKARRKNVTAQVGGAE